MPPPPARFKSFERELDTGEALEDHVNARDRTLECYRRDRLFGSELKPGTKGGRMCGTVLWGWWSSATDSS